MQAKIINNQKNVLTASVNSRRPSAWWRYCFSAITSLFFVVDRKE